MTFNTNLKAVTGRVRLSYQHLDEPSAAVEGAEPKYSATLMIPKSDTATKAKLDKAVQAAIEERFQGKLPRGSNPIYKDGDKEMERKFDGGVDLDKNPEYAGHWIINASAKATKRPFLLGPDKSQAEAGEFYSGCYVRASLIAFGYDSAGNTGVSFNLQSVMKVSDGEPLGGSFDFASDFEDDEDGDSGLI